MDILKQKDFEQLVTTSAEWCVSMYMPAHRAGRRVQQDPIRLKNLSTQAQEKLLEHGVSKPQIKEWMRPVERLLTDSDFWRHQSDGLAVFISPDFSKTYRLASNFDELMTVGHNFHIKPLLPFLNENGSFYILAVSLNHIRLFTCTRHTIDEVQLSETPTSMKEALYMDLPEKHLDFHTSSSNPGASGNRQAMFHGHGGGSSEEEDKKNILRYFQYVDKGLSKDLQDMSLPIVWAGVDYLMPIYQQANTYPGLLLEEGLMGNPDEIKEHDLHQRAWQSVELIFNSKRREAFERYLQLKGKKDELASDDLSTIVKAAINGRVDTLFVPVGIQQWGRFDAQKNEVIFDGTPAPQNQDLFDFAARNTILNSGRVFAERPQELPQHGEMTAILRF